MAPGLPVSEYDAYAAAYSRAVAWRERADAAGDGYGILPYLLESLGDVRGRRVLDAGCGEGYLARVLSARGAQVTGIDLAPRLIEQARRRDPGGVIDYRVADLSRPLPGAVHSFDAVASYLVLNDVRGYRGFVTTLGVVLKPGGRLVLAINNPYNAVIRKSVTDYFQSEAVSPYRGLWEAGIRTYYRHRTLQEYLDAFLSAGLSLVKLTDIPAMASVADPDTILPPGGRFPRFMLLTFTKAAC